MRTKKYTKFDIARKNHFAVKPAATEQNLLAAKRSARGFATYIKSPAAKADARSKDTLKQELENLRANVFDIAQRMEIGDVEMLELRADVYGLKDLIRQKLEIIKSLSEDVKTRGWSTAAAMSAKDFDKAYEIGDAISELANKLEISSQEVFEMTNRIYFAEFAPQQKVHPQTQQHEQSQTQQQTAQNQIKENPRIICGTRPAKSPRAKVHDDIACLK